MVAGMTGQHSHSRAIGHIAPDLFAQHRVNPGKVLVRKAVQPRVNAATHGFGITLDLKRRILLKHALQRGAQLIIIGL